MGFDKEKRCPFYTPSFSDQKSEKALVYPMNLAIKLSNQKWAQDRLHHEFKTPVLSYCNIRNAEQSSCSKTAAQNQ